MSRPFDPARTLHVIGDVHVGAVHPDRLDAIIADLGGGGVPAPRAHVQVGDLTDHGLPDEDEQATAWLERLPAGVIRVAGNHDVAYRAPQAWAEAHGLESPNYTVDLGVARLIVLAQAESIMWPLGLSAAGIEWLDAQLGEADQDCVIACHAPPFGTVGGDVAHHYVSTDEGFGLLETDEVAEVLARHPNAKAWISGHTHSPVGVPGMVMDWGVGGRSVVAVNASCVFYTGRLSDESTRPDAPLVTLFVTYGPDAIGVRFRDHWAGRWLDEAAVTLPIPQ